ncbi:hypothetical protein OS175_00685 [Marinicella sp. S1101]|uniref:hypothetical protein n=1 Tax=Marinicella marina TaxID=2996016 RepID=UPI00226099EC|nr:hypothetical protein [Marinicella marina]MCX7552378.1 hypothetical protein [Marinicella marina]MDJ1139253.1 hypothetical protein [Marinicella marina]
MITHIINKKDAAKNNIDLDLGSIKIEVEEFMKFEIDKIKPKNVKPVIEPPTKHKS